MAPIVSRPVGVVFRVWDAALCLCCIATLLCINRCLRVAYWESVPFTCDRSNVHLHAVYFADLNAHGTCSGPIQQAGLIEIHDGFLNTGTPGWGLPVEHHTRVVVTDSPLLQGRSCRTLLASWPPTHRKKTESKTWRLLYDSTTEKKLSRHRVDRVVHVICTESKIHFHLK